jgi:hypothetical protein
MYDSDLFTVTVAMAEREDCLAIEHDMFCLQLLVNK